MTISIGGTGRRGAVVFLLAASLLTSGFATDRASAGAALERRAEMLALTNDAREARDREALTLDEKLSRYARRHSAGMAEAGALSHTEDLAARLQGRDWTMGGENVGYGSSLAEIQDAFMASKPHRRNLLQEGFDHVAIGVVRSDGTFWVTVIFYG